MQPFRYSRHCLHKESNLEFFCEAGWINTEIILVGWKVEVLEELRNFEGGVCVSIKGTFLLATSCLF